MGIARTRWREQVKEDIGMAEIMKHFDILIACNAIRGCENTWDRNAAYTL
jgi:hypothetical protein